MARQTTGIRMLVAAGLALGARVVGPSAAEASPIAISTCYTGDCSVFTGSLIVTITDDTRGENDGAGDVKFVLENLTNGFVDEFGLRYDGGLSGAPAVESFSSSSGRTGVPSLILSACQNDNSRQGLNVCFDLPNRQSNRLNPGESVTFFVDSVSATFLASHFDATRGYAHIQGLPGGGSVKLVDTPLTTAVVPEPGSLVLLALGLAAAGAAMRRKKRREEERARSDASAASSAPRPPSAD